MAQLDGLSALADMANGGTPPIDASSLGNYRTPANISRSADSNHSLAERDRESIQYDKSLLNEGDTLVFIKYPNNEIAYNSTGFPLRTRHVVHSENLLATGSERFSDALNSREQQLRLQRRFALVGRLPKGIKYLLDLTPPEEGDDALLLTARLSCPPGVRKWWKSQNSCGVAKSLVGGRDEVTLQEIMHSMDKVALGSPGTVVNNLGDSLPSGVTFGVPSSQPQPEDALEYCPLRHRTGIERLLQVIEGKNPRLDSAPKVWTLVALADYFGCAKSVEDHVVSWLLADPNTRFIEILPEAAIRIGVTLQNEYITRFSFAVLVSEEAIRLGSGNFYRNYKPNRVAIDAANFYKNKKITRFGRPIEDIIDEDWTNIVQYAAHAFAERIHKQVTDLLHPDVTWLNSLPEYQKIIEFHQFLLEGQERDQADIWFYFGVQVETLLMGLRDFIRGRMFRCMLCPLAAQTSTRLQTKRVVENLHSDPYYTIDEIFGSLNDQEKVLTRVFWKSVQELDWALGSGENRKFGPEPVYTRGQLYSAEIWEQYQVRYVTAKQLEVVVMATNSNMHYSISRLGYNKGIVPPELHDYHNTPPQNPIQQRISPSVFRDWKDGRPIAGAVFDHVSEPWTPYDNIQGPSGPPNFVTSRLLLTDRTQDIENASMIPHYQPTSSSSNDHLSQGFDSSLIIHCYEDNYSGSEPSANEIIAPNLVFHPNNNTGSNFVSTLNQNLAPSPSNSSPNVRNINQPANHPNPQSPNPPQRVSSNLHPFQHHDRNDTLVIGSSSPLLNLATLFKQINDYLVQVTITNLSKGDFEASHLCDTLLSLSDTETRYLPLWAGGMNDGSGGVFAADVPLAERGSGAPNQPGPKYHTGSTLDSAASDFDVGSFSMVEESLGRDTSLGVENGVSDNLDRREVVSEGEFPASPSASEDTISDWTLEGGLEDIEAETVCLVTRASASGESGPTAAVSSDIEDDNFFNAPDESGDDDDDYDDAEWDFGMEDDDSGEETETE